MALFFLSKQEGQGLLRSIKKATQREQVQKQLKKRKEKPKTKVSFGSRGSLWDPRLFPGREARAETGHGPDYGAVWKPTLGGEDSPIHEFSPGCCPTSRDTGHGSARGSLYLPTRGGEDRGGAAPSPPVIPSTRGGTAPPLLALGLRRAIHSTTSRVR